MISPSTKQYKFQSDTTHYYIPLKAIKDTEHSLRSFRYKNRPEEIIVFWAGTREVGKATVSMVIVPDAITSAGRVLVSQEANFHFVKALSARSLIQIAQVHTHPTSWVDHSYGDGKYAAFKVNGLLSIVVPSYCTEGMLPLEKCGIHRFYGKKFKRLHKSYINAHFHILNDEESELEDLKKRCSP